MAWQASLTTRCGSAEPRSFAPSLAADRLVAPRPSGQRDPYPPSRPAWPISNRRRHLTALYAPCLLADLRQIAVGDASRRHWHSLHILLLAARERGHLARRQGPCCSARRKLARRAADCLKLALRTENQAASWQTPALPRRQAPPAEPPHAGPFHASLPRPPATSPPAPGASAAGIGLPVHALATRRRVSQSCQDK